MSMMIVPVVIMPAVIVGLTGTVMRMAVIMIMVVSVVMIVTVGMVVTVVMIMVVIGAIGGHGGSKTPRGGCSG